jgi:hypothetical protein
MIVCTLFEEQPIVQVRHLRAVDGDPQPERIRELDV